MSTRRDFIKAAAVAGIAIPVLPLAAGAQGMDSLDDAARWERLEAPEGISQEQIRAMVMPSHFSLEKVKEQLAAEPRLVHGRLLDFDEAPIEAASHVGNVEIADYLLGRGARFKIQCAAMLGMLQAVEAFLDERPELVTQPGAHGLPLMYHAGHCGKVEMLELLKRRGGGQDYSFALHSAAEFDNPEVALWLLAQGAELDARNGKDHTPLDSALHRGSDSVAQVLRDAGAVPSPPKPEEGQ